MSKKTIAIVDYDWADLEIEESIVKEHGWRLISGHAGSEEDVIRLAGEADGIVVQYAPITGKVLDKLQGCRVISRYGIGVDSIDVQAATERGIPVCNVPDYCFNEVTDHAVALIMGLIRRVMKANTLVKKGEWSLETLIPIPSSNQCTIGVVGFGGLGRILARKMKALGYPCIASDPFQDEKVFKEDGVKSVSLEELLREADVVTLHAPYSKGTHHMIGEKELAMMKPTAYLVNTSRGKLVDSTAMVAAVKDNQIAGVGLDVLEQEPPDQNNPLLALENVYITPHIAFYSEDSIKRLRAATIESVVEVLSGRVPRTVLNPV